jgi:hypothetical protein
MRIDDNAWESSFAVKCERELQWTLTGGGGGATTPYFGKVRKMGVPAKDN